MFIEQPIFESPENLKDYTSKIELVFMRHDEKENDKTKTDEEIRLTSKGKMHVREKAEQNNIDQSMAFGSSRKRTQETAGLIMSGKLEEITGTETLEELKEKINKGLFGSKIGVDSRLDFKADFSSNYVKKAVDAMKNGKYLKFLVEDSDRLAKEEKDNESSTYAKQAQAIASIIEKYYDIAPRFNELAKDKNRKYEDTMKRFFGSHQGVLESFLAKLIEKTKGVEERNKFVEALNNQGFDYAEGFKIEILNKESDELIIHISYRKEKDGEKVFEFDEDLPKELIDALANPITKSDK